MLCLAGYRDQDCGIDLRNSDHGVNSLECHDGLSLGLNNLDQGRNVTCYVDVVDQKFNSSGSQLESVSTIGYEGVKAGNYSQFNDELAYGLRDKEVEVEENLKVHDAEFHKLTDMEVDEMCHVENKEPSLVKLDTEGIKVNDNDDFQAEFVVEMSWLQFCGMADGRISMIESKMLDS